MSDAETSDESALLLIMVSRERVVRLASRGAELANARRVRLAAHILLFGGVAFLLVRLRSIWHDNHIHLTSSGWAWLTGATALGVAAVVCTSFIWLVILRRLGLRVRWPSAAIYLQAQLGKYVPGGVWQYASRGAMARGYGLSVRVVAKSLPIELAAAVCAGAAFAFLAVGWWGVIAAAAAIVTAAGGRVYLSADRAALRVTAQVVPLYAATWPLIGVSFWMTAHAFLHIGPADIALYTGAFAAAWIVGLFAIYAPGGIGVREAMLVAILGPRIGSANALVIAAASRVVFTLADLVPAALSIPLLRRQTHLAAEAVPPA
jgi:uncharacterized membrane protein YbhN (UPF0104 family)